jgi:hypothetical protein
MVQKEPLAESIDRYGAEVIPWSRAREQLDAGVPQPGHTHWLATVRPDGRPHVAAVGTLWIDGEFYFTAGPGTRKARNIAANPEVVVNVSLTGLDLVVEGHANKVTDRATLERVAADYNAVGWPARVEGAALTAEYSAPSAGPPPWEVYAVTPVRAFGVASAEPYGATRWTFPA